MQIIFAGKAHPADEPGKELIKAIYTASRSLRLAGKIVFVEDYDMSVARHLVSGCDVWLNNPIRPHEASGTSGQKAALNGIPNCSILDGWWAEGYQPGNGWAIGEEREYQDAETQNAADAEALYEVLERDIVPCFFDRDDNGIPPRWIDVMRAAIRTCAPRFSMRRQVKDYTQKLYLPAAKRSIELAASQYEQARSLARWKQYVRDAWPAVSVNVEGPRDTQFPIGKRLDVVATVTAGHLNSGDLRVELVVGRDRNEGIEELVAVPLDVASSTDGVLSYQGGIEVRHGGSIVYGVRVLPYSPSLTSKFELGLVRWA